MAVTFLKPEHLSPLSTLSLRAKHIVEGLIAGMHKSPYHGFSSEFLEFRPYRPGESASKIDWRKFAKTERNFVKLFEDETNLYAHILLDKSNSMSFSSIKSWNKFEYAKTMAAAIAWVLIRQKDAVGLALFSKYAEHLIKPGSTNIKLKEILTILETQKPSNTTNSSTSIHKVASTIKKRGLTILISDLFDNAEDIIDSLHHLKFNGQDIIVIRILDPYETSFNPKRDLNIIDLETSKEFKIDATTAMEAFTEGFNKHNDILKKGCQKLNVDLITIKTNEPFAKALIKIIEKRGKKF